MDEQQLLAALRVQGLTVGELAAEVVDPGREVLASVIDAVNALEARGVVRRVVGQRMVVELVASL